MSKARLVVAAIEIEHRPISEVARDYRVARSWIYTLLARYRAQGEAGLEPRSRRPASNPRQSGPTEPGTVQRHGTSKTVWTTKAPSPPGRGTRPR
jgi:transposase